MPITPENLVRHELMGLAVKIVESSDPTQKGVSGKVVGESYNTLTIEHSGREKDFVKSECVFVFTIPGGRKVQVDGDVIVGRPEDRIKKKQPKW